MEAYYVVLCSILIPLFWKHPHVEAGIVREINSDQVKSSSSSGRRWFTLTLRFAPVPVDLKAAINEDVLPDGTVVEKGTRVAYHVYAMGRVEKVWGKDCKEFKPERWLEKTSSQGKWKFLDKDPYTYPVEMAFIQMKRVVASVLRDFKVVPVLEQGVEPEYVWFLVAKMKGGLPVMIQNRE